MKSTGIVRKIDQLGRIVLPKELRKVQGIEENKTVMEIFTEEEQIILRKYEPACIFCSLSFASYPSSSAVSGMICM